ncbi:membrane-spanning 4-domains subfamily A member 14 isoform X2 [Dasypus novemcinctus]|uniref:membrane-spanning 4-domains subfamily A member 14 isoform X2 n=1 Tax=Dasypus novemcinctus TaxID=9361 RepID=UPI00266004D6|nr:membrane-spanning 4-domains subfamily A member 14 isoform X2 [Dasypus novemcinctus]
MMESPTQLEGGTQVVTIQPQETVLTAFPYRPQITLLDFLKGESKVLATVQILLALIIAGIGAIFAFNYAKFFYLFPLVFFTGYPFWGAFIFILTGYLTGTKEKKSQTCLGRCVLCMNIISSLAAVAGIILTIISYKDEHENCQTPTTVGICVLGRTLFMIVFFLPSDVTQNNELHAPEANAQLQFELQEESSSEDTSPHIHTAFFGGYAFFKLRVSASSLASQPTRHLHWRSKESYYTSSLTSLLDGHQENLPPSLEFPQEEIELESLPSTLQIKPSDNTMNIQQDNLVEQVEDEQQQFAMAQTSKIQAQLSQAQDLPLQVFPSHSTESLMQKVQDLTSQELSSDVLPNQVLQPQDLQFEDSKSHSIESHISKTQKLTLQDLPPQNMSSQDMPSQDMPTKDMLSEAPTSHISQSLSLLQQSSGLQPQDSQLQDENVKDLLFQDIESEVMSLTKEWKFEENLQARKSPKWLSLIKCLQSSKQRPTDEQSQGQPSPKQKFLDQQSKDGGSPKKQYPNWEAIDKQTQDQQHPHQQAEDKQAKQAQEKQSPKQQPQNGQDKGQKAEKKSPMQQVQDQQSEDQQAQKQKPPKGQSQDWQVKEHKPEEKKIPMQQPPDWKPQIQQYQGWQSQDWRTQGWREKDWKPQEWKFEVQHPLYWESQTWQAQNLEKEALKQKALYQEAQTQHAIARHTLDWQIQDVPFQDHQNQDEHQQNLQSGVTQKEDMQVDSNQTKDVAPRDRESRNQKPTDLQSENINFPSSFCQDSVKDTHFSNLSSLTSEQDMQLTLSTFSSSDKDLNSPSTSYCPKDGQESEDYK